MCGIVNVGLFMWVVRVGWFMWGGSCGVVNVWVIHVGWFICGLFLGQLVTAPARGRCLVPFPYFIFFRFSKKTKEQTYILSIFAPQPTNKGTKKAVSRSKVKKFLYISVKARVKPFHVQKFFSNFFTILRT